MAHRTVIWSDVVPAYVALKQEQWERRRRALRMRAVGLSYEDIAMRMGVEPETARSLCVKARFDAERPDHGGGISPVQMYWCRCARDDLSALAWQVRLAIRRDRERYRADNDLRDALQRIRVITSQTFTKKDRVYTALSVIDQIARRALSPK